MIFTRERLEEIEAGALAPYMRTVAGYVVAILGTSGVPQISLGWPGE